ncbi:MAG TPA: glycosyltransferase family 4 protein [Candidatus Saccharimonadales bacterium]|nr:glycosyltransferase family 4 protein [Candidatus Saccharimonadales bacterium]
MNIALLAPFEERVPPRKYGGTERVVYTLAEELHRLGHNVSVFASGDSHISGRLIPIIPKAFGSSGTKRLREAYTYRCLAKVVNYLQTETFDIIHNHIGWQALLFKELIKQPMITTIHWVLDNSCERTMYDLYRHMPVVSISKSQRKPLPRLHYAGTVYHGLDLREFSFNPKPDDYLAFLGRFSPVKGPLEAIEVAKRTGSRLVMAAKINEFEREFFETQVRPHIDGRQIIFVGELGQKQKIRMLQRARALLTPIKWEEPFGLTNIEAMAVGTPVIALRRGSMAEIIKDGQTGMLCDTIDEMVQAVAKIDTIARQACRAHVEKHFTATRMAERYLTLYARIASAKRT